MKTIKEKSPPPICSVIFLSILNDDVGEFILSDEFGNFGGAIRSDLADQLKNAILK